MPQIALYRDARGYIDPSRWDDGMPVLFTNYAFSGSQNQYDSDNTQRQYLNMQNGANIGPGGCAIIPPGRTTITTHAGRALIAGCSGISKV